MPTPQPATTETTILRITELPTGLSMVFGGRLPPSGQPPRRPLPDQNAEQPRR